MGASSNFKAFMQTQITKPMGPIAWLLLIFLSILWGGSFFFSKIALSELQPFTVVLGRVSIAAIALIFNERVETHQLVGMIVIGVSLIVIDGRVPTAISARLSGPQPIQPSTAKDKNA